MVTKCLFNLRLIHVAISKNETRDKWMNAIQHSTLLDNLIFILGNSMNGKTTFKHSNVFYGVTAGLQQS